MAPPTDAQPGPTLQGGRYVIERKLGQGGHAAVYRVTDTRLGVRRAVKILLGEAARRPKMRARFEVEARTMASLDHPHVVRVLDVITDVALPYLVMEHVTGGSLARWLEVNGPMPPRLACACVRQAALGAAAAHAQGVVHRDIKPHNVLVTAAGVCKLTDFGIAQVGDLGNTRAGAAMGTQGYMAPEQAKDASTVDRRVDVFSLGMTLFVLATDSDPLERVAGRGLDRLPEPLRSLVERSTAFERSRRPDDVAGFLEALDLAVSLLPADPPAPSLALDEGEGEPLDTDEMSTLADERKTTDASSIPPVSARVLPYSVPAPVAATSDRTPDWVERSTDPRGPRKLDVVLDRASPSRTPTPSRPLTDDGAESDPTAIDVLGPEQAAEEASTLLQELSGYVLRTLMDPWRMSGPALLFVVVFVGLPVLQTRGLREAATEARDARKALTQLLKEDRGGLDAVVALGGDRATLETLYADWQTTKQEPARTQALRRYIEALENDLRLVGLAGLPETDRARKAVAALRAAVDTYDAERAEYEAYRDSVSGWFAVGVRPP